MPDPLADEDRFVDAVAKIGGPAVVFPTHDPPLNALARHADRLDGFLFPFPSWERLESIQDKRHQLETAREADVDIPETLYPTTATEAAGLAFPVLVKPQHPDGFKRRFGKQAFRCETKAELERAYADAEPFGPMVQELVPGGDEELYSFGSYLRADGEPLGLFSGRKLKQVPPVVGTCRVGEAVWVQEVVDAGLRLLQGARLPRDLAGRVQARSARRPLQADGGQPAPLAVARARRGVRRRPAADRVPRPDR